MLKLFDVKKECKEFGELPGHKEMTIFYENENGHLIFSSQYKNKPKNGIWCIKEIFDFQLTKSELLQLSNAIQDHLC